MQDLYVSMVLVGAALTLCLLVALELLQWWLRRRPW